MSEQEVINKHEQHGLPGTRQIKCKVNGKKGIIYLAPEHIQIFTEKTSLDWFSLIIAIILIAGSVYGYIKIATYAWAWILIDIIALLLIIIGLKQKTKRETIVFYEDSVIKRKHDPPFHKKPVKQIFSEKRSISISYNGNKATLKIKYGNKTFSFKLSEIRETQAKLFEEHYS